jgi:hypothetical protein
MNAASFSIGVVPLVSGATVDAFVSAALQTELPTIVTELSAAGVRSSADVRPIRVPLHDAELVTFQNAAKATRLDQSLLLFLSLRRLVTHAKTVAAAPSKHGRKKGGA